MPAAKDVANAIQRWADKNGFLAGFDPAPVAERATLHSVIPTVSLEDSPKADSLLERTEITAILVDEDTPSVSILTAGHLGPRNSKVLPNAIDDVNLRWIGSAAIHQNPMPLPTQPTVSRRCYIHNGRIACGSSVTAATIFHAGTLGCLVRDGDGDLCGLTNNHVTGGCNHMLANMPILSPSPLDATPTGPEPRTIGRHKALVPLDSGNPQTVQPQKYDSAIFKIENEDLVSSIQGTHYDTPTAIGQPTGGKAVKKVGRTTEVTTGVIHGHYLTPIAVPYRSPYFNATVYLDGMIGVAGDGGNPFSEGGDSGALVVTADEQEAIGLIVGGMGNMSIVMPIGPVCQEMGLTLVGLHNI